MRRSSNAAGPYCLETGSSLPRMDDTSHSDKLQAAHAGAKTAVNIGADTRTRLTSEWRDSKSISVH